jgi:hypothetical protein
VPSADADDRRSLSLHKAFDASNDAKVVADEKIHENVGRRVKRIPSAWPLL